MTTSERTAKILVILEEHASLDPSYGLKVKDISGILGISYDAARHTLNKMVRDELIVKEGKLFRALIDSDFDPIGSPMEEPTPIDPPAAATGTDLSVLPDAVDDGLSAKRPMKAKTLAAEMMIQDAATPAYLMRKSGFDLVNLRVAISILKKRWPEIFGPAKYDRKNKIYNLSDVEDGYGADKE